MKLIQLHGKNGIGKFAQVDDEDYDFLMQWKWFGVYVRTSSNFYAICNYHLQNGKWTNKKMHVLLLNQENGLIRDHIDGDGLNNQRSNLRYCTKSQNAFNKRKYKNGSSEFKGVTKRITRKGDKSWVQWLARIQVNKKSISLGSFPFTEEGKLQAAMAYTEAAKKLFGEFYRPSYLPVKH